MQRLSIDTIKVYVTSHCNLNCNHCYQSEEKNKYQLPIEKLIEIVDFALEVNTKILDFSGGEFFVHPFAYDLLEYCYDKKIKVNVATNGVHLKIPFFERYRNTDLLMVQVSVDGTKETHEKRRGFGTYDKTLQNMMLLHKLGIPLTVCMALDEQNYRDALDVLHLPNVTKFIFMPVALTGAAGINCSERSSVDYEETICHILKTSPCTFEEFSSQIFPRTLAIKYDGNVYISPVASDYNLFSFGNLLEHSLRELIANYIHSNAYKKLTSVKQTQIAECRECSACTVCDGGCRLRALKFFGDILKPDPFYCRLYANKFTNIPLGKLFWGES